jgi:hypothetical protein
MQHISAASQIRGPAAGGVNGPRFCRRIKPRGLLRCAPGHDGNYLRNNSAGDVGAAKPGSSYLQSRDVDGKTPHPAEMKAKRSRTMRFMVIVKADSNSEAGVMPSTELLTAMGKFNEEMVKAGVMLAGEGLHPSSKGARIKYSGKQRTVIKGPFKATGELVSGFWLIQVKSHDEAIEWMKRAPFDGGAEIEIRQVFDAEDFGEALTPELREQEQRLRAQAGSK